MGEESRTATKKQSQRSQVREPARHQRAMDTGSEKEACLSNRKLIKTYTANQALALPSIPSVSQSSAVSREAAED